MHNCPDFSHCNVIVIGDAMLDRYWHGDSSRISPEAPVPVVNIDYCEERVGGAANVAINVQALGAITTLISAIGEDEAGIRLASILKKHELNAHFIRSPALKTTLKLRVLGRNQQLIRLDFENKHAIDAAQIIEQLKPIINKADIVILSDYAKGILADPQPIIAFIKEQGVRVIVDPKNADFSLYQGASLLTPNLIEFEAAVGRCETPAHIASQAEVLIKNLALEGLLVTQGSQGMTLIRPLQPVLHIPAKAREVFDVTGAGDTVIAVLGTSLAKGLSFEDAAILANIAGGLSVGRLGTATISADDLNLALMQHLPLENGIVSVEALQRQIIRRKKLGERIVMTNGCFDILHAGHITYLQQARAKGDCLIVAVNDDSSVKGLKGDSRPINPLAQRMQILAALECVDYVVAFGEETPQKLIAQILPNILVKGGDYLPHQIAGAKEVLLNGGAVEILSFVPGCSTTKVLERLEQEKSGNTLSKKEVVV